MSATPTATSTPAPDAPTRHRMRLVERPIEEDTGDFEVFAADEPALPTASRRAAPGT